MVALPPQNSPQTPITLSIRAKAGQRDLIDLAAEKRGQSRSDFMLSVACREAENILLDQTFFAVSAENFETFKQAIDNPPAPSERLKRLMLEKAPWE